MASPFQIRAARALLGWRQEDLAEAAIVCMTSVRRIESGRIDGGKKTYIRVIRALRDAGIDFLEAAQDMGEGVRRVERRVVRR